MPDLTPTQHGYLALLYRAANSPLGIEVSTPTPDSARREFQHLKSNVGDESLSSLVIRGSPNNPNHLWLVKKDALPRYRPSLNLDNPL